MSRLIAVGRPMPGRFATRLQWPMAYDFAFTAPVERHEFDRWGYTVVYLPGSLEDELPLHEHPRLRVDAEVEGWEMNNALNPAGGRWYLILSRKMLRETGLKLGDEAHVRMSVADQDAVDVPAELLSGLAGDAKASKTWQSLTAGKRRGYAYRVSSAKREETRAKRVVEVLGELAGTRRAKKRRGRFG